MPKRTKTMGLCWFLCVVSLLAVASDGNKSTTKDVPPKLIYTADPEYTPSARHDRIQGVVTVTLNVDADGVPHDMKVVRGLRSDLDKKAIEAVGKWRFTPAIKDGKPTAVFVNVQVAFRLY